MCLKANLGVNSDTQDVKVRVGQYGNTRQDHVAMEGLTAFKSARKYALVKFQTSKIKTSLLQFHAETYWLHHTSLQHLQLQYYYQKKVGNVKPKEKH